MEKRPIGMSIMKNNLSLDIQKAGAYRVSLSEVDGHEVYRAQFIFSQGVNHISLPHTIESGAYVTSVQGPDVKQIQHMKINMSDV